MKAKIFEIKRFAVHDGDGIRTTVFFKGCPLKCVWCHNPEGLDGAAQLAFYPEKCVNCMECVQLCPAGAHHNENGLHRFDRAACTACGQCAADCAGEALKLFGREVTVDELLPLLLADRPFYEDSNGGVTLSGGECLLQAQFCAELLRRLKEQGIHTAVDTCGFVPRSALEQVLPYTDIFLYDLKAADEDVHLRCTGRSCRVILDNLRWLDGQGAKTEIRIPYVPDWNDTQMEKLRDVIAELKNVTQVKVLAYHDFAGSKYRALELENTLPARRPDPREVAAAQALFCT